MAVISQRAFMDAEKMRQDTAKKIAESRNTSRQIQLGIAAAMALWNYLTAKEAGETSLKIQQRALNHRKVFWPFDMRQLSEYATKHDNPEPVEEYGSRYAGRMIAPVAGEYAKQESALKCAMSRWCTSANENNYMDLQIAKATDLGNARVSGYQLGYAENQEKKILYFNRRLQSIGLGAGAIGTSISLASQAAQQLGAASQQSMGDFMGALQNVVNGYYEPIAGLGGGENGEFFAGVSQSMGGIQIQYSQAKSPVQMEELPQDDPIFRIQEGSDDQTQRAVQTMDASVPVLGDAQMEISRDTPLGHQIVRSGAARFITGQEILYDFKDGDVSFGKGTYAPSNHRHATNMHSHSFIIDLPRHFPSFAFADNVNMGDTYKHFGNGSVGDNEDNLVKKAKGAERGWVGTPSEPNAQEVYCVPSRGFDNNYHDVVNSYVMQLSGNYGVIDDDGNWVPQNDQFKAD